ncbi:hypothetical protein [Smaragdicoccus niigatensis]|uniref:hypothetical protein n=1 Tax=Smaragdicoccus niigatensis TaxID=359359 RepID=UPI0003AA1DD4|nr:hypothetical protein [Smaragdicoccus niigatensis]
MLLGSARAGRVTAGCDGGAVIGVSDGYVVARTVADVVAGRGSGVGGAVIADGDSAIVIAPPPLLPPSA